MRKPKKPCKYPGCPELTDGYYCAVHQKIADKQYEKYGRDKVNQKFYSSTEWRAVKKRHLMIEPLCRECMKDNKLIKATIVDHIIPRRQGGAPLDDNNLQSLCWSCHSRKSAKEGSRWGR